MAARGKTCLVLGARGFIGSAVAAEAAARGYGVQAVDLDNYAGAVGAKPDLLVFAAGNSRKFIDDRDPLEGFRLSVEAMRRALCDFHPDFFLLLSSGAVYPDEGDLARNAEDTPLDPARMTRYGFHKRLAELLVLHECPRRLVLRMGGFVGPGLRKNAVRDVLSGGPLFVNPASAFQFMHTRDLARAAFALYERAGPPPDVVNVSARGTATVAEIAAWAGRALPPETASLPTVHAELNLGLASTLLDLPETAPTVRAFVSDVLAGRVVLP